MTCSQCCRDAPFVHNFRARDGSPLPICQSCLYHAIDDIEDKWQEAGFQEERNKE